MGGKEVGEITIGQVGRLVVDVGKSLYTPVTTFSWKSGSHTKFSGLKIGRAIGVQLSYLRGEGVTREWLYHV